MKSLLLVGAGQLGSRYLQGLVGLEEQSAIMVVDPSEASLEMTRVRLAEVQPAAAHLLQFSTSLESAPQHIDLAMVVTPAHCRAQLVEQISSRIQVNAWILEKLLAQSCEQLDHIERALAGNSKAWVNTPRRLMGFHQTIRSQLLPNGPFPLRVCVNGGSWGIACNGIHYIDLVSWWSQSKVRSLNTAGLSKWMESKRAGFYDVSGSVIINYANGSELVLSSGDGDQFPWISVETPFGKWKIVDEPAGCATGPCGEHLIGQLEFHSVLMAPLVNQILYDGNCALPTVFESAEQHRHLLSALLEHWNRYHKCNDHRVPIT